jgi:DNA-binding transcriptional MerR regulator
MIKVAKSLIRYWEGEFEIINPKKDNKGNRRYTKSDIQKIKYIYHLVKEKGFTLQGAQEVIKQGQEQGFDKASAIQKLEELKDFLINIRDEFNARTH